MIPFRCVLEAGSPAHEQVAFAARKAIVSGKLRPGDPFPSVRALSKAIKIHANTAQKVVGQLIAEGLLEARPGIGTVVAGIVGYLSIWFLLAFLRKRSTAVFIIYRIIVGAVILILLWQGILNPLV